MRRTALLLLLLVPAAFLAGRMTLAEEKPETVKAKRYAIVYAESALDLSHGGGRWVTEIFLPHAKVGAMLVFESPDRPVLHAWPQEKPHNDCVGLHSSKPSPIEEIEIPASLAKEIVALAELTKKQREETRRLGRSVVKKLGLKPLPR
jgi:hypothetical protein